MQLRALGAGLRAIETVSSDAATKFALHVMFNQIRKFNRPMWEQEVLATAEDQFHLPWRDGHLAAWSWGRGPTVVLVHGWEGRGSQMGRFVDPLVSRGFRVVTFDGPGHGDSTTTRGSMPDQLAAIERVAQHVGSMHGIVGHSMGAGAVAIAAARRVDAERFVLVAPPTTPVDYFKAAKQQVGMSTDLYERLLVTAEEVVGFRMSELDAPTRVQTIDAPALIIHDRTDREVELRHGQAIHEAWTASQLMVTDGLGHRRILKDRTVIDAVTHFLSE